MNALQRLNEQLQNRGLGPAEFTYVKTGTDHFPNFQASMVLEDVKYTGDTRGTKKLAAQSCAEKYFTKTGPSVTQLIVSHTNETTAQLVELSKSHQDMCVVTDDRTITTRAEFDVEYDPPGVGRAITVVTTLLSFYDDDDECDIVVKTKNPEVIAYVNAMKSGQVGGYEEDWKTITIV